MKRKLKKVMQIVIGILFYSKTNLIIICGRSRNSIYDDKNMIDQHDLLFLERICVKFYNVKAGHHQISFCRRCHGTFAEIERLLFDIFRLNYY